MKYLLITAQCIFMAVALHGGEVRRPFSGTRITAFDAAKKIEEFNMYTQNLCVEKQKEFTETYGTILALRNEGRINEACEYGKKLKKLTREIRGCEHAMELFDSNSAR